MNNPDTGKRCTDTLPDLEGQLQDDEFEGSIKNRAIRWLIGNGCIIINNVTGTFFREYYRKKDGKKIRYKVRTGKTGSGDIVFCNPVGRYGEIETKRPGEDLEEDQIKHRAQIIARNGIYVVVRRDEDLEDNRTKILT